MGFYRIITKADDEEFVWFHNCINLSPSLGFM